MTPENEKLDLLLALFAPSLSPSLLSRWFSLNIQDLRGVAARTAAFAPPGWIDRSRVRRRPNIARSGCSPHNGSLNIGHRGGGARIPDTSTCISTDSGIIPLAWPVVLYRASTGVGRKQASKQRQPARSDEMCDTSATTIIDPVRFNM